MAPTAVVPGSFRDPSGFVFFSNGQPFRQVNASYRDDFEALKSSGLIEELQEAGLLIRHEEIPFNEAEFAGAIAVLRPEKLPFISYPYEWCFGQKKDAALCTLEIQRRALAKGITLKDASAFNIQFVRGRPILIDTLSFERYVAGSPWVAYKQFCQHFMAPLALRSMVDERLGLLTRPHIDGIPLDLAAKLLPFRSRLNFGLALHIHLHAKAQAKRAADSNQKTGHMSMVGLLGLVDSLRKTVEGLRENVAQTEWADYYENTNYSAQAMSEKQAIVRSAVQKVQPKIVWDLGANVGEFSDIAAEVADLVLAWDMDSKAVERNYQNLKTAKQGNVLPLLIDLSNPSPSLGWAHRERDSFVERANADLILALALVHHLAIGNNVPLRELANFFSRLAPHLVIEFVPKSDSQVQRMLATRKDVFSDYDIDGFERAFADYFKILERHPIPDSNRVIYLMERGARE